MGRAAAEPLPLPGVEIAEAAALRERLQVVLQRPRIRVLQPPPGREVGVVDDDVRVWDTARVVVVVDNGHLVVGEVIPGPRDGEVAQPVEGDGVAGVG